MAAPDKKRIIASCIYAAVSLNRLAPAAVTPSESDDEDNETQVVEKTAVEKTSAHVPWGELSEEDKKIVLDVTSRLFGIAPIQRIKQMDCAKAAKLIFDEFGVGWAAIAAHIYKNVSMEFANVV